MKKILAMILVCLLAAVCLTAVAEESDDNVFIDFGIKMDSIPEGYAYQTEENGTGLFAVFYNENDSEAAIVYVSVALSEEFEGVTLNRDLTEEEFEQMEELLTGDYNDPIVEIRETDYGTKLIVISENDAQSDYADMITLWKGYFITVGLQKNTALTEEDVNLAVSIVSNMWIIEQ